MEKKLRIFYFKETDSMDIWFDDPEKEQICEEIDDAVLLKKDKDGNVIGIEIISIASLTKKPVEIPVSILAALKPVSKIAATVG
ncbi:MAG: DUF2283 domain-containing protein [Methanophagales archaeon]|nr:DUF2283 domain-containing protein [Methanophagales archaeon]